MYDVVVLSAIHMHKTGWLVRTDEPGCWTGHWETTGQAE